MNKATIEVLADLANGIPVIVVLPSKSRKGCNKWRAVVSLIGNQIVKTSPHPAIDGMQVVTFVKD